MIRLDPVANRTYHYWHVFVPGVTAGPALRLPRRRALRSRDGHALRSGQGPARPLRTRRGRSGGIQPRRRRATGRQRRDGDEERGRRSRPPTTGKATRRCAGRPRRPSSTRCTCAASPATRAPASTSETRGTFAGLIEKIPYLSELGHHGGGAAAGVPVRRAGLPAGQGQLLGLRAGLVLRAAPGVQLAPGSARPGRRVPRHGQGAAPGGHRGHPRRRVQPHRRGRPRAGRRSASAGSTTPPTTSSSDDRSRYANYTGSGNTLNANHPIVRRMIVDSLRYWVEEMHVDGFRFDLASILARDATGQPIPNPPVLWDIESDPVLAGTKLIAEAWDAAGLYQVGSFIGDSWKEWNGRFRDDVRAFFRGEPGSVGADRRPAGRQPRDLRARGARGRAERQLRHLPRRLHPERSRVLRPQAQRGQRRGQPRRRDDNRSWNCGVEGPTDDPGDREAAEPAGEELPDGHAALARRAR